MYCNFCRFYHRIILYNLLLIFNGFHIVSESLSILILFPTFSNNLRKSHKYNYPVLSILGYTKYLDNQLNEALYSILLSISTVNILTLLIEPSNPPPLTQYDTTAI